MTSEGSLSLYPLHQINDSDSEYFHSSQSNVKVKDEIVDDVYNDNDLVFYADDYDEDELDNELDKVYYRFFLPHLYMLL